MLELIGEKQGGQHHGEELRESDEQLAREMLREAGWTEKELRQRKKGDKKKVRMAGRLRADSDELELDSKAAGNGALAHGVQRGAG